MEQSRFHQPGVFGAADKFVFLVNDVLLVARHVAHDFFEDVMGVMRPDNVPYSSMTTTVDALHVRKRSGEVSSG